MEKQKRWQFFLILAVIVLTIYNILPTIFYYAKPLKKPIGQEEAQKVAVQIVDRVNSLEEFTVSWLKAQSKNLGFKPTNITLNTDDPRIASISFKNSEEATLFAKTLARAGSLIPFVPAQLNPDPLSLQQPSNTVLVQRRIGVHLDKNLVDQYFKFTPKFDDNGIIDERYRAIVNDRIVQISEAFGGTSDAAKTLSKIAEDPSNDEYNDSIIRLARTIVEFENSFGDQNPITQRYYASFTQINNSNRENIVHQFTSHLERIANNLNNQITKLQSEQLELKEKGAFLDSSKQQMLETWQNQKSIAQAASAIVRRNVSVFQSGKSPLDEKAILADLQSKDSNRTQIVEIGDRNPFVNRLIVDWNKDTVNLVLHDDVQKIRNVTVNSESSALQLEKLNQLLFNEIANASRNADEKISPTVESFVVNLNTLTNSTGLLTLDIGEIAKEQSENIVNLLNQSWKPKSSDFSLANYPIVNYSDYLQLPKAQQKLALVVYSPAATGEQAIDGLRNGSIYVIARGLGPILQKYNETDSKANKGEFEQDFRQLHEVLRQNGFIGYAGTTISNDSMFKNDYIFELNNFYADLVAATREDFFVHGSKKYAVLEFTDVEQRILTLNKIDTRIHEDLVKWRDEYHAAQVNLQLASRYDVPPPTENVIWSNLKLSTIKYFRGDNRKILRWGLDLSGGKTVRIGLRDQNNRPITEESDLRQAVNELYTRVNKMGVSEVAIRIEGPSIVLDFPGSQGLSAADLIQASAMYFHIVNEKFTANNPTLAEAVNAFLEEVWNEAVITNRTDVESINEIAWQHLGGNAENPEEFHPITSHARLLYDNGLRFAGPKAGARSSSFDDTLSAVSMYRGEDFVDWQGQTYPLLIVFRNYALEGANLVDVNTGYDPSEGNILFFGVKSAFNTRDGTRMNPREDFYSWTSQFSEEKILGTPKESFSQGRGWRMAVILNGTIISAPLLNSPLRDSARISGHFSQREVNQLAADLKAGSLSFTPHILSEENISPDLGQDQRNQGIMAAGIGLLLVIGAMIAYYRFGGVVASVAVIVNLLIMWGVLQNLDAALTLPGIAGIILTVGMAVDANVLVFERIREEFAISGRLPSAISAGYRKAFTAIVDSNLTTIIAALILLNFDSGPIKGFAVTLIIGIVSSMFTSLFMTRYFFAGWVQNPKHKTLSMARFFGKTKIDFLSKSKLAFISTAVVLIIGCYFLVINRNTIFGMDFTGGYALTVDLVEQDGQQDYRKMTASALEKAGASTSDFQIRELNNSTQLRIQLGMGMEQPGKPFYLIDQTAIQDKSAYKYQENPRIVWIVNALENGGLKINPTSLNNLDFHWTEMSGQLSDSMRNNALIGLGLALLCILIYITFRFEFKFAISATLGLAHDVLVTMGIVAILHLFDNGIQIDLQVIAALMTIIGYSLNDTIIIFDRIREDMRLMRKMSFFEIVNHALNATLSRTVMTSGTTLLVLVALVVMGGTTIFNFALVMFIGVAIGTLSSLFVAAPLLLYFHNREIAKRQNLASIKNT